MQVSTDTVVDVAFIDSSLKNVGTVNKRRPTVDEVGVKTVTGSVTVRPYPSGVGTVVVGETLGLEDKFVKERDKVNRVGSRTITTVDTSRWPGHVTSMIIGIEIDSIPTVWEVDLSSDTLRTLVVREERVSLVPIRVSSVGTRKLETDIGNGLVVGVASVEVPSVSNTRKHPKTVGESVDLLVLVSGTREVVGVHVVDGDHRVRLVGRVVVVELGDPVVRLVLLDERGRTFTGSHRLVRDRLGKSGTTSNRVHMSRDRSWVHDTAGQPDTIVTRGGGSRIQSGRLEDLLLHDEESIGGSQEWQQGQ